MPMSPKGYVHVLLVTKYNGVNPIGSETEAIRILKEARWHHSPLIRYVFSKTFQAVENASLNSITAIVAEELGSHISNDLDIDIVMQVGNIGRSVLRICGGVIKPEPMDF